MWESLTFLFYSHFKNILKQIICPPKNHDIKTVMNEIKLQPAVFFCLNTSFVFTNYQPRPRITTRDNATHLTIGLS